MNNTSRSLLATVLACGRAPNCWPNQACDLRAATIDDLMSIDITSASPMEQRAADVSAADFAIHDDDTRLSRMTTIQTCSS